MTTDELIQYYVNLLIMQYATKANAVGTIAAFVAVMINDQIYGQVGAGFNFTVTPIGQPADGAVGAQLDAIASYRGASRVVYGLAPLTFFQMVDAEQGPTFDGFGFMDAANPPANVSWFFLLAEQTNQPIYSLTDDQLYRLTQFKAQVQSMDMTIENIDNLMQQFFGDNVAMFDNENMTMYYVDLTSDTDPLFGIVAQTQSFPRPAGVLLQAFKADMLTNWFGLQDAEEVYDPTFSGFSDAETTLTTGTFISAP